MKNGEQLSKLSEHQVLIRFKLKYSSFRKKVDFMKSLITNL